MAKTKFFRIAVEGPTVDGRVIDRKMLEEMAASYDPATYTARINCEHIAGFSPDKPFNAYGSVLSLKTEEFQLNVNGKQETRLALYAEIDANDNLVAINKAGQKLFTSCEVHPDFVGKGKSYLVGLAVTDTPASLGTEPLKFAAMARPNLFTPAEEASVEVLASTQPADIAEATRTGILAAFAALFKGTPPEPKQEPKDPPEDPPANDNLSGLNAAAFAKAIGDQIALAVKPASDAAAAVAADLAALKTKLEAEPAPTGFNRKPATGGGNTVQTDC
jgi:hypothetical protein